METGQLVAALGERGFTGCSKQDVEMVLEVCEKPSGMTHLFSVQEHGHRKGKGTYTQVQTGRVAQGGGNCDTMMEEVYCDGESTAVGAASMARRAARKRISRTPEKSLL